MALHDDRRMNRRQSQWTRQYVACQRRGRQPPLHGLDRNGRRVVIWPTSAANNTIDAHQSLPNSDICPCMWHVSTCMGLSCTRYQVAARTTRAARSSLGSAGKYTV